MRSIKLELTIKYAALISVIIFIIAIVSISLSKQMLNSHIKDTKLESNLKIFWSHSRMKRLLILVL